MKIDNTICARCANYDCQTGRCQDSRLPASIFALCDDDFDTLQEIFKHCTREIFRAGAAPSVAAPIVTARCGCCAIESMPLLDKFQVAVEDIAGSITISRCRADAEQLAQAIDAAIAEIDNGAATRCVISPLSAEGKPDDKSSKQDDDNDTLTEGCFDVLTISDSGILTLLRNTTPDTANIAADIVCGDCLYVAISAADYE